MPEQGRDFGHQGLHLLRPEGSRGLAAQRSLSIQAQIAQQKTLERQVAPGQIHCVFPEFHQYVCFPTISTSFMAKL